VSGFGLNSVDPELGPVVDSELPGPVKGGDFHDYTMRPPYSQE
jgi:hypothetical protein